MVLAGLMGQLALLRATSLEYMGDPYAFPPGYNYGPYSGPPMPNEVVYTNFDDACKTTVSRGNRVLITSSPSITRCCSSSLLGTCRSTTSLHTNHRLLSADADSSGGQKPPEFWPLSENATDAVGVASKPGLKATEKGPFPSGSSERRVNTTKLTGTALAAAKEEAMDNWDIFSIDTGADWWAAGFHATPHQQPSKTGVVDLDQSSMTSRA
eukprot:3915439-Rhodomonas_salina.4